MINFTSLNWLAILAATAAGFMLGASGTVRCSATRG